MFLVVFRKNLYSIPFLDVQELHSRITQKKCLYIPLYLRKTIFVSEAFIW